MGRNILKYVDVAWLAKHLGKSNQSIDEAGRAAMKPTYRGSMLRPDAEVEGRPLWLKERWIDGE